jgi:hypothetical protein
MRRARSQIPTFSSVDEEAAFWDTHDSTEFEAEFEPVTDTRFEPARPRTALTVQLDADTLARLTEQARRQGVSRSALVRAWIIDRLNETARPA